ncbi:NAD(P)H-dependent oxidoreductase [uncultured Psychroserpens sp.]|uniref:flavodoxin family protein n=1 Tax=uncultured Psychroserpens sp. TaxID=255436 RepID=UPI0026390253|nr:NAD(P)H-dependent oxidoreductase [uncultured Psychroserpens sp.]
MKHKTIIILGSSRPFGHTRTIVDYLISHGNEIDLVVLSDYNIGYFDYELKNEDDDFHPLLTSILGYDTILFATPVYWYTMSAQMKTFFDRISDVLIGEKKTIGRQLKGKVMGSLSCGSDQEIFEGFEMPFTQSANYLGMTYIGHTHTWLSNAETIPKEVLPRLESLIKKL